ACGQAALKTDAGRALALAGWETGAVTVAFNAPDAARLASAAPARAMVNALAFGLGEDFDAPAFEAVVKLAALALAARGEEGAIGLGGVADWLVAQGLAYDSAAGRAAAAGLYARAAEAIRAVGAPLAGGLAVFDDPELSLMLGGARASAEPWSGPATVAETADGVTVRTLSEAALAAFARLGVDPVQARAHALGHGDLAAAPGIDHASLQAKGFTDYEIGAAEAALAGAHRLSDAFSAQVVGEGFLSDVLGLDGARLAASGQDVLTAAGFGPEEIAAAEAYALGAGGLADAAFLTDEQRQALAV